MKKQRLKKFYTFILAVIGLFLFTITNAQIVYTDVIPDKTITATNGVRTDSIDLNSDGISDFQLSTFEDHTFCATNKRNAYLRIISLDSNLVVLENGKVKKISDSTIIGSNSVWGNYDLLSSRVYSGACFITTSGLWGYYTSGKVGLKLNVSGQIFYGWVSIFVHIVDNPASASIETFSYAYNSIPNQPILAGETTCTTPTVTLSASGSLSFCTGDSVTLTANGTGYQYQWKKNNVNISGATKQTYAAKTAGIYKCKVTNSCGSKTSGSRTVTVPCRLTNEVFTEQLESPNQIIIAPNPLSNLATISFSLEQSEKVSLKIFDLNGRLIKVLADNIYKEGENDFVWNSDEVNAGVYLLEFQSGENLQMEKLVVTK